MNRLVGTALAAALALAPAACASNRAAGGPGVVQERTTLVVDNQNFLDFTIYLIAGGQRIRLGLATGNTKTRMTIPAQFVFGATSLQFQADPIGGRRAPVSQAITVSPGDEVELTIPPNA